MVLAVLFFSSLVLLLTVNSTFAANVTADQITNASGIVKSYVETNHKLPNNVIISENQLSMPQYLKLSTAAVTNINHNSSIPIPIQKMGAANSPSENVRSGMINKTEYLDIANRVNSFMNTNGKAPDYIKSSEGNIRYDSLVYMYSEILNSYNINGALPDLIITDPWSVISDKNTVFYNVSQVNDASNRVKSSIEANHKLPNYITMSGKQVSMPSFLRITTTTLLNIEGNFCASSVLKSYKSAPKPVETIKSKNMNMKEYINIACSIKTFMDDPNYNRAPNYAVTSFGNMRFESLIYMYSQLLSYYNSTNYLPANITVNPWSVISNKKTVFFTKDQLNNAVRTIQSYIETNHKLPNSVAVSGTQISMPQFLQLSTEVLLNIDGSLCTSFLPRNYGPASSPSENITSRNIDYTEYLDIANRANSFMNSKGKAPNNINQSSTGNIIRYESLVYLFASLLNSYKSTNGTLPYYITVTPWSTILNSSTVFLSMDEINDALHILKSNIDSNHVLPDVITVAGKQITLPQFLQLSTAALLNIESSLNTSIVLKNVKNATNSTEDIVSGDIQNDEYTDIAQYVKNYIDSNGTVPDYVYQTSLGTHMGFESLVYMYAEILDSYSTNKTLPDYITVTPWIAVSNPDAIYNYQSNKIFNSVQEAVDDKDTVNGNAIGIGKAVVSENIVVNKELIIMSTPAVNVTVQAADPNLPVFMITNSGSGSIIQDLIINGAANSAGIYINNSFYSTILDDIISGNNNGVHIYNSTCNPILDSDILNNTANGIFIDADSNNNTIRGNNLIGNSLDGISINSSDDNTISCNIISSNTDGIYLNNSSAYINFNRIVTNSRYGLYKTDNGTVDATNNWWGSNNPVSSSASGSDIYIPGGNVVYDPWLVLSLTSSCDRSDRNGTTYNYTITADITHNNRGEDTYNNNGPSTSNSSDNTLPDDIPLNFITTFGTVSTSASTRNGKTRTTLNSTEEGSADVTVTLDNQAITIPVNITNVAVLGITNTRTDESFATIQAAIDSSSTLDGDTLTLAEGTYTENVVVYKNITIEPFSGAYVIVQAANPYIGVFTIVEDGSTIQNLNIAGAVGSYGILSYADNINIIGNTITANSNGITLFDSNNAIISGNDVMNNWYGINLYNSASATISRNNITNNWYGSSFYNSTSALSGNSIAGNWYGAFINTADNVMVSGNTITDNNIGIFLFNSASTTISGNTITDNQVGISYYKSNSTIISENTIADNSIADTQQIDTTGVVMQNNIWDCGPASLATVLNKMGINATQDELASLAEVGETGTTMYGLIHAAQSKGLNAVGMTLSIDQLKPDYIVLLITANGIHYSVITGITNTTVYLADSSLGNINMTIEDFTAVYAGYALIITNSTNDTNNTVNGTVLTNEQMQSIEGTNGYGFGTAAGYILDGLFGAACIYGSLFIGTVSLCMGTAGGPNNWKEEQDAIRKYEQQHQYVHVGSGGYSYGYSYSYPHGYNTRGKPLYKPYIPPVYKYGLYVATSTGWAYKTYTTTSNPTILKNQRIYKQYLTKRAKELAKIAGLAGFYLENQKQNIINQPPEIKRALNRGTTSIKIPPRPDDDELWKNVPDQVKEYWEMFKEGIKKKDPKYILVGGGVVAAAISMPAFRVIFENEDLIENAGDAMNETIDKIQKMFITKSQG